MPKVESVRTDRRKPSARLAPEPALGPGLHAATIELATKRAYRVRLLTGERVMASLATEVDPLLAAECLRERRSVLVAAHPEGARIIGAVQVSATLSRPERLRLEAAEIELAATRALVLRVGKSLIAVDERGVVHLVGERMTMRMAKAVRVISANVELP